MRKTIRCTTCGRGRKDGARFSPGFQPMPGYNCIKCITKSQTEAMFKGIATILGPLGVETIQIGKHVVKLKP